MRPLTRAGLPFRMSCGIPPEKGIDDGPVAVPSMRIGLVIGGDEFGELSGRRAEDVPLADGPSDGERVQGWDGDGADRAVGWIGEPGRGRASVIP